MIFRLINLDQIARGNLSGLEPGEHKEALERAARCVMNLAASPSPEPRQTGKTLSLGDAAKLLRVSRPWLAGSDLPFVHQAGRSRFVPESELRSYMGAQRGRFLKPAEAARTLSRNVRWVARNAERLRLGKRLGPGVLRLSEAAVRKSRDSLFPADHAMTVVAF